MYRTTVFSRASEKGMRMLNPMLKVRALLDAGADVYQVL